MYDFKYCEENFTVLGEGTTRRVYEVDSDIVVKLPVVVGGTLQNRNEIALYKKYKNTVLPLCQLDDRRSTATNIFMKKAIPLETFSANVSYDFDIYAVDFIESCHDKLKTRSQKDRAIHIIEQAGCDSRVVDFLKKISMFRSEFISRVFYDVVALNCGWCNDSIVVIDYGFPDNMIINPNYYEKHPLLTIFDDM